MFITTAAIAVFTRWVAARLLITAAAIAVAIRARTLFVVEAAAAIADVVIDRCLAGLLSVSSAIRVAAFRRTLVCTGNAGVKTNRAAAVVARS